MENTFPINNGGYTVQQGADSSQESNLLMDLSVSSSNNHSVSSLLMQDDSKAGLIDLSNQENKTQQAPLLSTVNDQNSTLFDHHRLNQNYVESFVEPEKMESDNHNYSPVANNNVADKVDEQLTNTQPNFPNSSVDDFGISGKSPEKLHEVTDSSVSDQGPLEQPYECKKEVGVEVVDKVGVNENNVDENELKEPLNEELKEDIKISVKNTESPKEKTNNKNVAPLKISITKQFPEETKVSDQKKVKTSPMKLPPAVFEGENDAYCWKCHKEGEVICCESCPRVYHLKCLNLKKNPEVDTWFCPVCIKIMNAESMDNPKKLPLDRFQLAEHLKYAVKRLEIAGSDPFRNPVDTEVFSDYTDYIFHPMDVYTIEEKRKARKYGSTEAFGADVEWILHNCIVYNGVGKLSMIAKQMVKTAEFEMKEIEVCPECYLNAGKNRPDWFCEPCQKNHRLIWAKLAGFPHWPAKALKVDGKGLVDARFFGQHDRAWVREENCYLYSKEMPHQVKNKKKAGAKGGLDNAIAEAQRYVDNVTKKFGKFEWATLRQPLAESSRKISTFACFQFDDNDAKLYDCKFENNFTTLSSFNCKTKVVFANVAFSKGSHYWQFKVLKPPTKGSCVGFGVAHCDVTRSDHVGCDVSSWGAVFTQHHCIHKHAGNILNEFEKGIKVGSVVGMFLHFASKTLTVFNDGMQQGDPISIYNQNERLESKIYFPVISLNKSTQVTLQTGMVCPQSHISMPQHQIFHQKQISS